MVTAEVFIPGEKGRLTLKPNCSLSWGGNLRVMLSALVVSLIISVGFLLLGAWVVVPFIGLELLFLCLALYYVCSQARKTEVISVNQQKIMVKKNHSKSQYLWAFQRLSVVIMVRPDTHNPDRDHISLSSEQGWVEVGQFLCKDDQQLLLDGLISCGLRTSKKGYWSCYAF